ncbi:MAG: peptidase domain-containing ABC transporter [Polyangiaceae bacterium]|nr:peptidase domain-containing ABC transporter [Polyangiaceae bacterium]
MTALFSAEGLFARKVPFVAQLSAFDCGPACLTMLLRHHGRNADLAEVRTRVGSDRGGVTTLSLVQAARSFGFVVRSFSVEPKDLTDLPMPVIAHWGFDHYVVIERMVGDGALILDPARGRRHVGAKELDEEMTGVVLTFAPGVGFSRVSSNHAAPWKTFIRAYLRAAPDDLIQALVVSVVIQLLGLSLPVFTALVLDHVSPQNTLRVLPLLGFGALAIVLSQALSSQLRAMLLLRLEARIDTRFVPAFFGQLLGLPLGFFEQRTSADLILRVASQSAIRDILTGQTFSLVLDGALVVGYLALLLARAPLFGALVLVLAAVQAVLLAVSARRASEIAQEHAVAQAEAQSYLVEMLFNVAAVKAAGAEPRVTARFTRLFQRQVSASLQRGRLAASVETAMTALRTGAPLAMLWVGASAVLRGEMSAGTMLALCALGASFLAPVSSLVQQGQRLPLLGTYLARLSDVVDAKPEQAAPLPEAPRLTGRIEVRDVGFRYGPAAPWVLRGVSFTVEPGQTLAIVGRTGCGKTTLLKLLLGLYAPTEGEILYDGKKVTDLDRISLRRQFGVVLQESALHQGSIRENIAFGDSALSLDRIESAAKLAVIDEDIALLPMGYDTPLGDGGSGLSGGQRQRLSLARALAHEPAILFLDEATSHLDRVTERRVDEHLRALSCSRVVIAHRLSTVRGAEQIVVLDGGTVAELGKHDELVRANGQYAQMVDGSTHAATAA